MSIIPKETLLLLINQVYENTPEVLKKEIAYIGVSGSYIFNLEKEKSDYDISIIFSPQLVDEKILNMGKFYFSKKLREKIQEEGFTTGIVDVHSIRNIRWINTNNVIATFCMKYQTDYRPDLGIEIEEIQIKEESMNYYLNTRSYGDLFNEYVSLNKGLLSNLYYFPEEENFNHINELFYHVFLMYNVKTYGQLYSELVTKEDVEEIKKLVKGKINYKLPANNYNYIPMEEEEQTRLFNLLQEKLKIILTPDDLYSEEKSIDIRNLK